MTRRGTMLAGHGEGQPKGGPAGNPAAMVSLDRKAIAELADRSGVPPLVAQLARSTRAPLSGQRWVFGSTAMPPLQATS